MPLGMQLLPVVDLISAGLLPAIVNNGMVLRQSWDKVPRDLLCRRVLPWMSAGVILGMGIATVVTGNGLKKGLGVFVVVVSFHKLYELLLSSGDSSKPIATAPVPIAGVLAAGLIHGVYSTGGPPLVWSIGRANLDRDAFRGIMAAIWVPMTFVQAAGVLVRGSLTLSHVVLGLATFPGMVVGMVLGNYLRSLLPERELKLVIYSMLAISGASLLR
eukprot:gnl/TRDRNA2_/TRDRNA2_62007_c0_seq1.p1 gnl/TRDRNA2_/TRDRNA2_62007_c0~~gnl/TRDRNA2_/TRDRNA2_62007_c0_seq1.p1  ORF type:complete len:245 (+),score=30.73 gnl/TRDRNA2_/TRDRNA2_62007_c0_seq1:89-736(+)